MLSVPISFLRSINFVISEFINFRIFPRISFDTACSRLQGGFGLINLDLQQCALQIRWLEPLLCQSTKQLSSHPSIVFPRLVRFLISHLPTRPNPQPPLPSLNRRFCLLFPGRRSTFSSLLDTSWFLLFKALDHLPADFFSTTISAATCLEIPLASLVLPGSSLVKLTYSFRSLSVSTAYILDTIQDYCMRPKRALEFGSHPNLGKKFLDWTTAIRSSSSHSLFVHLSILASPTWADFLSLKSKITGW